MSKELLIKIFNLRDFWWVLLTFVIFGIIQKFSIRDLKDKTLEILKKREINCLTLYFIIGWISYVIFKNYSKTDFNILNFNPLVYTLSKNTIVNYIVAEMIFIPMFNFIYLFLSYFYIYFFPFSNQIENTIINAEKQLKNKNKKPALFEDREVLMSSLVTFVASIEAKNFDLDEDNEDKDDTRAISIDADWGFGKTFFMNHLKDNLEAEGITVFTYNAWKNDYEVDPLKSLICDLVPQMMIAVKHDKAKIDRNDKVIKTFLLISNELISILTNKDILNKAYTYKESVNLKKHTLDNFFEKINLDKNKFDIISNFEDSQKKFENQLNVIYEKIILQKERKTGNQKIIILIDELDRCRPTFAVEFLERIKHFFDTGKYLFIFTICSKQLKESVRQIYGNAYEETGYFRRFFDFEFYLPEPNIKNYLETIVNSKHSDFIKRVYSCFVDQNISLRDCNKINKFISTITKILPKENVLKARDSSYLAFGIFIKFMNNQLFKEIYVYQNVSDSFFELSILNEFNERMSLSIDLFETTEPFLKNKIDKVSFRYWIEALLKSSKVNPIDFDNRTYKTFYYKAKNTGDRIEKNFSIFASEEKNGVKKYSTFVDTNKLNKILLFGANQHDATDKNLNELEKIMKMVNIYDLNKIIDLLNSMKFEKIINNFNNNDLIFSDSPNINKLNLIINICDKEELMTISNILNDSKIQKMFNIINNDEIMQVLNNSKVVDYMGLSKLKKIINNEKLKKMLTIFNDKNFKNYFASLAIDSNNFSFSPLENISSNFGPPMESILK